VVVPRWHRTTVFAGESCVNRAPLAWNLSSREEALSEPARAVLLGAVTNGSIRGLPRAFWVLWVGTLLNRIGSFVQPFLALYLVGQRGMSVERAGDIVALVGLGWLGAGPAGGALADRLGRRAAMAITTTTAALAMVALGIARQPAVVAACALALGLFGGMYGPVCAAIVADVVAPADRQRAYGLRYWAANIGFAIAPALAGLIATRSYATLFIADGATTLVFGAIVVAFVPETRPDAPREPIRRAAGLVAPYRDGPFAAFVLVSFVIALVFQQVGSTLPMDIQEHAIGARTFGLLIAVNGAMIVVLQPYASGLTSRWPRASVVAIGAILTGAGFGLPGLLPATIACYAASIGLWTLGEIAMAGVTPAIVADFAPAHLRGGYHGAFQLGAGAAAFLAPLFGTFVLRRFGSDALWRSCLAVGLAAAAGYRFTVRDRTRGGASRVRVE
jgi:MFS family permease